MTMPALMNCSHSGDGWCLDCVKVIAAEKAALLNRLDDAVNQREYWETKCHKDTAQLRHEKAALERERDELKLLHEQSLRVQDNYELEERRNEQMRIVAENAERRLVKERDSLRAQLAAALAQNEKLRAALEKWLAAQNEYDLAEANNQTISLSDEPLKLVRAAKTRLRVAQIEARAALAQEQP